MVAKRAASADDAERARQEAASADASVLLREAELAESVAVLDAAREGIAVSGDSDGPQSLHRADQIAWEAGRLEREAREALSRASAIERRLAVEEERLAQLSGSVLQDSAPGVVWRLAAREGEWVERGDVVAVVADCSTAVATALVSDRGFNRLVHGSRATVTLVGEGRTNAVALAVEMPEGSPDACAPGRAVNVAFR